MAKTSKEIWALTNLEGQVLWSPGGSSTSPKLLLYDNEASAKRGHTAMRQRTDEILIITKIYSYDNR